MISICCMNKVNLTFFLQFVRPLRHLYTVWWCLYLIFLNRYLIYGPIRHEIFIWQVQNKASGKLLSVLSLLNMILLEKLYTRYSRWCRLCKLYVPLFIYLFIYRFWDQIVELFLLSGNWYLLYKTQLLWMTPFSCIVYFIFFWPKLIF